ncbi:hypothetical protein MUS_1479 [Bacillus velezensis YAU B9601-Y2]|uniref:Uncharacterized protein n=1 Tax=Bacillus amyloliquefaciens (strain Y2) TaxID=1155777 RepID=I2C4B8_BACAY|nr:hypothetical protein MUS_1479 [Bacillus velezensis YAU B9601-Y2]
MYRKKSKRFTKTSSIQRFHHYMLFFEFQMKSTLNPFVNNMNFNVLQ